MNIPPRRYKRARTGEKKPASAATATARASPGLKRYLSVRGTPNGVYEITRTATGNIGIVSNGGFTNGTVTFKSFCLAFYPEYVALYDPTGATAYYSYPLPNAAEIAALWDNIKIDKIEMEIVGAYNPGVNTTNGQVIPLLGAFDNNDRTSDLTQIKQMDNDTIVGNEAASGYFKKTIRPTYNTLVYYTALTSGYKPERGYFRSDYNIEHLGYKIALDDSVLSPTTSNAAGRLSFVFRYHLKCKNLK